MRACFWLLHVFMLSCVSAKSKLKVLNGVASPYAFPATVGLAFGNFGSDALQGGRCTGTFIRPDLILTAAHCFTKHGFDTAVVFDRTEVSADGTVQRFEFGNQAVDIPLPVTFRQLVSAASLPKSSDFYTHPDYQKDRTAYWADIAVLKFKDAVVDAGKVAKIATQAAKVGDKVSVVGFGLTISGDPTSAPGTRHVGTNRVVPTAIASWGGWNQIKLKYPEKMQLMVRLDSTRDGLASADGGAAVPDGGDSGGPLYNTAGEILATDELGGTLFPGVDFSGLYVNLVAEPTVATFVADALQGRFPAK